MATAQNTFSIVALLLSCLFILSTSLSKEELIDLLSLPELNYSPQENLDDIPPEPSTSVEVPDPVLPPEPTKGFYKFLEECSKKITSTCGAEVYTGIVENEKVSGECCVELIKMGHACHIGFAKLVMEFPEEKEIKSQILARAEKVWNDCVRSTGRPLSPSS